MQFNSNVSEYPISWVGLGLSTKATHGSPRDPAYKHGALISSQEAHRIARVAGRALATWLGFVVAAIPVILPLQTTIKVVDVVKAAVAWVGDTGSGIDIRREEPKLIVEKAPLLILDTANDIIKSQKQTKVDLAIMPPFIARVLKNSPNVLSIGKRVMHDKCDFVWMGSADSIPRLFQPTGPPIVFDVENLVPILHVPDPHSIHALPGVVKEGYDAEGFSHPSVSKSASCRRTRCTASLAVSASRCYCG